MDCPKCGLPMYRPTYTEDDGTTSYEKHRTDSPECKEIARLTGENERLTTEKAELDAYWVDVCRGRDAEIERLMNHAEFVARYLDFAAMHAKDRRHSSIAKMGVLTMGQLSSILRGVVPSEVQGYITSAALAEAEKREG